jgi:translation initiation factor 2B subunit (eIF-2B alpha/beta/delta family)
MPNPSTNHPELLEPLQSFLESFTQELTEQQFVPALRDELKRLLSALDSLQRSEDTLQQIARGVDRLREVFAPAGTRLLESAKDIESVMRSNADLIKDRAGDVLNDLLRTHEQLEGSLRDEAGLLQEHASASREALGRTVVEVEERLSSLGTQVDLLCKRLESESANFQAVLPSAATAPAVAAAPGAGEATAMPVRFEMPDDLRALLQQSEHGIQQELETYRTELTAALKQGRGEDQERLARLDHKIAEALESIAPKVQEELETAVARLRDQIQTLILAEVETRGARTASRDQKEHAAAAVTSASDLTTALTATETRILREIASVQKSQKGDLTEGERILKNLAQGFEDAAQRYADRAVEEGKTVKDAVASLQRIVGQLRESDGKSRDQISLLNANLDALVKGHREYQQAVENDFHATLGRLDAHGRALEQKSDEDKQLFAQLASAISRSEQAATTATELALADSRAQREKIEAGLKDLRERLERGQIDETERMQDTLRRVAEAWTEALEALRDFIQKTVTSRTDNLSSRLESIESRLAEGSQPNTAIQRELQNEIKRTGGVFDQRIESLKESTEVFTSTIEGHVKAVSDEVIALRGRQEQQLVVLQDAIRANYDDNAAKLKDVIESAYDSFVKQTAAVPQALDRYSHLIQSLYQGDQLALQGLASDTKNLLTLSTDRFEVIVADSTAMKKFFPLLDKKLEKQAVELEMVRKAQVRQEKDAGELNGMLSQNREALDEQNRDLREHLMRMQAASDERFAGAQEAATELKAELIAVKEDHLPAFRREVTAMLASKFEFIESTLHERQEALRKEITDRLNEDREASKKPVMILSGLVALSLLLQIVFHFMKTPGAGH